MTAVPESTSLLDRVRGYELECVHRMFQPGQTVVELGGGNGFQAAILASWGCTVHSFDLPGRPTERRCYPVTDYDGEAVPLPDGCADVVFSSNVLEHVRALPILLADTLRILRPGGMAVHILPTPAWRWWTIVAHYPFLVLAALRIPTGFVDWSDPGARRARAEARGLAYLARRILWPGPHGEFPGALHELVAFRAADWVRHLTAQGFEVLGVERTGLFYTGYGLIPAMGLNVRRKLAKLLGSSTQVVCARKPDHDPAASRRA